MNPEIKQTLELVLDLLWVFFILFTLFTLTYQKLKNEKLTEEKKQLEAKLNQYEFIMSISDDISAEMFKENELLTRQLKKYTEEKPFNIHHS